MTRCCLVDLAVFFWKAAYSILDHRAWDLQLASCLTLAEAGTWERSFGVAECDFDWVYAIPARRCKADDPKFCRGWF